MGSPAEILRIAGTSSLRPVRFTGSAASGRVCTTRGSGTGLPHPADLPAEERVNDPLAVDERG